MPWPPAAGNRTTHTVNGVVTTNSFDLANRLTASGATTYSYDPNGNQTGRVAGGVTTSYAYNALDQLTAVTTPTTTASYAYNGDGLRVAKTVGGTTTRFAWDHLGLPVVLADGDEYVWGQGLVSRLASGSGALTYAHADGLGSIRLLTDGSGAVAGTKLYDAFGASRGQTGTQLSFGYTGEQEDAESGLVYLRARYLDPSTGRFLTTDPVPGTLEHPASQHGWTYVENRPLRWVDRTGESPGDPQESLEQEPGPRDPFPMGGPWGGPTVRPPSQPSTPTGNAARRGPPNPNGSRGGPAHQEKIKERIDELLAKGHNLLGGGRTMKEEWLRNPFGKNPRGRRPDITTRDPIGNVHRENVGRTSSKGDPVTREQRALDDIERWTGCRPDFVPYDR